MIRIILRIYVRTYIRILVTSTTVAIYSRVSTKDKGQDVTNQLRQLREFCSKLGYSVVREYVDYTSAKTGERDAFKQMFEAASRREFDVVLFWALDRFSREGVFETLQYLQRLTSYGVGYKSYTEQYLDSCGMFRDAVISILASIAKQERIRLSERTIAGLERARAHGRMGGRPRVQCDREAVISFHKKGMSLGKIASELRLSKSTVSRIVTHHTANE